MIPRAWITPLVWGLPSGEAAVAVALATRTLAAPAALLSLFLSAVFAGVHAILLLQGEVIPCGCAGVAFDFSSRGLHIGLLVVSGLMVLASIAVLFNETSWRAAAPRRVSRALPSATAYEAADGSARGERPLGG